MEEEAALLAERDVELASAREAVRAPCVRYPTTTTHGNACAVGAHALVLNLVTESLDFSGDPQNHATQSLCGHHPAVRQRESSSMLLAARPFFLLITATKVNGFSPSLWLDRGGRRSCLAGVRCCDITEGAAPLTVEQVRSMFVDVRSHYEETGEVDAGQVCRNLMVTRVEVFKDAIKRTVIRPSELHGDGLFALHDLAEGDLITFFPGDALLFWEGGNREGNMMCTFGSHIPQSERDAQHIETERVKEFELYVSALISAVGDPARRDDPAYLGHFCNDGSTCDSPARVGSYQQESADAANARAVLVRRSRCRRLTLPIVLRSPRNAVKPALDAVKLTFDLHVHAQHNRWKIVTLRCKRSSPSGLATKFFAPMGRATGFPDRDTRVWARRYRGWVRRRQVVTSRKRSRRRMHPSAPRRPRLLAPRQRLGNERRRQTRLRHEGLGEDQDGGLLKADCHVSGQPYGCTARLGSSGDRALPALVFF